MTIEEAKKVIEILFEADGGCKWCAHHLIQRFMQEFPKYGILAQESYHEWFGINDVDMD